MVREPLRRRRPSALRTQTPCRSLLSGHPSVPSVHGRGVRVLTGHFSMSVWAHDGHHVHCSTSRCPTRCGGHSRAQHQDGADRSSTGRSWIHGKGARCDSSALRTIFTLEPHRLKPLIAVPLTTLTHSEHVQVNPSGGQVFDVAVLEHLGKLGVMPVASTNASGH